MEVEVVCAWAVVVEVLVTLLAVEILDIAAEVVEVTAFELDEVVVTTLDADVVVIGGELVVVVT